MPSEAVIRTVGSAELRIPYAILAHSNFGVLPGDAWRKRAARFYCDARLALFVSEAVLKDTDRQLLIRLPNAQIIRNPVNLELLTMEPWPEESTAHFATVGLLRAEWKGQDVLLNVFSNPRWRSRDWRLSIFGSGQDGSYLKGLAEYNNIADRVDFRGHLWDVRSIWRTHHMLVLPSRVEGAPLVIVEAMICGRPVTRTAVGGVTEWVRDGETGFIAEGATVHFRWITQKEAARRRPPESSSR